MKPKSEKNIENGEINWNGERTVWNVWKCGKNSGKFKKEREKARKIRSNKVMTRKFHNVRLKTLKSLINSRISISYLRVQMDICKWLSNRHRQMLIEIRYRNACENQRHIFIQNHGQIRIQIQKQRNIEIRTESSLRRP